MELNEKQYRKIAGLLPKQRGNVKISNKTFLNALIYRCENGCKWRALPEKFGNWHTIYMKLQRWVANGVLERVSEALTKEHFITVEVCSLDSTAIKAHPDAHGAQKKRPASHRQEPGRMEHQNKRSEFLRQTPDGI